MLLDRLRAVDALDLFRVSSRVNDAYARFLIIPSAVGLPEEEAGQGHGRQMERSAGRMIWYPWPRSARLARVDGGRDNQAPTSAIYGPGIGAVITPEPERPTGIRLSYAACNKRAGD